MKQKVVCGPSQPLRVVSPLDSTGVTLHSHVFNETTPPTPPQALRPLATLPQRFLGARTLSEWRTIAQTGWLGEPSKPQRPLGCPQLVRLVRTLPVLATTACHGSRRQARASEPHTARKCAFRMCGVVWYDEGRLSRVRKAGPHLEPLHTIKKCRPGRQPNDAASSKYTFRMHGLAEGHGPMAEASKDTGHSMSGRGVRHIPISPARLLRASETASARRRRTTHSCNGHLKAPRRRLEAA